MGRIVQGPRPQPGEKGKTLGKSASSPQDKYTEQVNETPLGRVTRITTFLQPHVPGYGWAGRKKWERLEFMMQNVIDELELLKRMKLGARSKSDGEVFRAEMRNNPPEDAALYINEVRGDAANRERRESDEERMARIERPAADYEWERNKGMMISEKIATETSLVRQIAKDIRHADQPSPEGSRSFAQAFTSAETERTLDPGSSRRLTPLRIPLGDKKDDPPPIPRRPIVADRNAIVEDVSDSPSIVKSIQLNSPFVTPAVQPLPSLFAATQYQEGSPSLKLRKKIFRKPITAGTRIKSGPGYDEPTAPLSTQETQAVPNRSHSTDYDEALYRPEVIRNAFRSVTQHGSIPRGPPTIFSHAADWVPRGASHLANTKPRKLTALEEEIINDSARKKETSYKTAVDGHDIPRQSTEPVRPPSTYSHDGDVHPPLLLVRQS